MRLRARRSSASAFALRREQQPREPGEHRGTRRRHARVSSARRISTLAGIEVATLGEDVAEIEPRGRLEPRVALRLERLDGLALDRVGLVEPA